MSSTSAPRSPSFLERLANLVMLLVLAWLMLAVIAVGGLALMQTPRSGGSIFMGICTVGAIALAHLLLAAVNPTRFHWILALSVSVGLVWLIYLGNPTKPSGVYGAADFAGTMCAALFLTATMLTLRSGRSQSSPVSSGDAPAVATD
jgi:hypothetical protein